MCSSECRERVVQPCKHRQLLGEPAALIRDLVLGCLREELGLAELGLELGDLALALLDVLRDALGLGGGSTSPPSGIRTSTSELTTAFAEFAAPGPRRTSP